MTVTFENGEAWSATFVSYRNVATLAQMAVSSGERLRGRYLAITDLILIDEISRPRIETVVADLLAERALSAHFSRSSDPGHRQVYLSTLDELDAASADPDARLPWLARTLSTLGFRLMSGKPPKFHELWAERIMPPEPAAASDPASDFERQFLAWLHITFGVLPQGRQGTNAEWWEGEIDGSSVAIGIVRGAERNPAPEWDWMLRVEEAEPLTFLPRVEAHFEPGSGRRRRMPGGRIRMQFTSISLTRPFADQAEET